MAYTLEPPLPAFMITGFSTANFYQTAAPGGESGINTGFIEALLLLPLAQSFSAEQTLVQRSNNVNLGHKIHATAGGSIYAYAASGGGAWFWTPPWVIGRAGANKLHLAILQYESNNLRLWFDRILAGGVPSAMTGFSPFNDAHVIGQGFSYAASMFGIVGVLTARGQHTQAQLDQLAALVRARNNLPKPAEWPFGITHRWSVRDVPNYRDYLDGDPAPPFIDCSITIAAADRMSRSGSPVVREIYQGIDGLQTYALTVLTTNFYLRSAVNTGIRGSTGGFAVRLVITPRSTAAGTEYLAQCFSGGNTGWHIRRVSNALQVTISTPTNSRMASRSLQLQELGLVHTLDLLYDGTNLYLVFDGVASAPTAAAGIFAVANAFTSTLIGANGGGGTDVFAMAGENGVFSASQLQQAANDFRRTGRLQSIGGANERSYDVTQDVVDNGGPDNGVPEFVHELIDGIEHLERIGTPTIEAFASVRGIRGLNAVIYYAALAAVGIVGSSAAFRVEWFGRIYNINGSIAGTSRYLVRSGSNPTGFQFMTNGLNGSVVVFFGNGTTTASVTHNLVAGDAARDIHLAFTLSGLNGTIYKDGVAVASGSLASGSFAPYTEMNLGVSSTSEITHIGVAGHNTSAGTPAEIAAAASASLAAGKLVPVAGSTLHFDFSQDVIDVGNKLPTKVANRAGSGAAVLLGAPMLLSENLVHSWGYDEAPILYRAAEMSDTSKYIACAGGTPGSHYDGLWFALLFMVTNTPSVAAQHLGGKRDVAFTNGWGFTVTTNLSQFAPRVSTTGSPNVVGPLAGFTSSEVGKLQLLGGSVDPYYGVLRTFYKRVEVGSGTSLAGTLLPASSAPCVMGGLLSALGAAAAGTVTALRIYGMMCGQGLPGLARWQAAFDAAQAREDIVAIPGGFTEHLWSIKQSVRGNGGVMPATIADRIGTDHMTVYGSLAAEAHYARAWGW